MITDPIFYRLFQCNPETFFLVLGMDVASARDAAAKYDFGAIEFKETAHRVDGVFRPKKAGLPLYFLEVQFYRLPNVYADLLVKAYTYLKHNDPTQMFFGVVLFAQRSMEPKEVAPYEALLKSGQIQPYYLDEMPEGADAPLGLSILYLIRQEESLAAATACSLIARTTREIGDEALRADLVELIETVIIYKLPRLSREEIQAMLQVHDIRETKVYQEAKEEGIQEGIEKERRRSIANLRETKVYQEAKEEGIQEGIEKERRRSIANLLAKKKSAQEIADALDVPIELVLSELSKAQPVA
jgi:predicted transposase/invertase (TIGR01784 family)